MKPVLVAHCPDAGSTVEVAAAVGDELGTGGVPVEVRSIRDVSEPSPYAAVVVGGPVILGAWHAEAVEFVTRQQFALQQVPVAFFITALHLIQTTATSVGSVPIYYDPALATPPLHFCRSRPSRESLSLFLPDAEPARCHPAGRAGACRVLA